LWGWVDADWAGDTDTRRSHTGYILMMNGGPISWKSRRQDNVSLSTSEAQFVAASQAGQEAIYLRETLTDFGYSQTKATLLHEDNLVCIAMSENPVRRKFSRQSRGPVSLSLRLSNLQRKTKTGDLFLARFPTNRKATGARGSHPIDIRSHERVSRTVLRIRAQCSNAVLEFFECLLSLSLSISSFSLSLSLFFSHKP